MARFRIRWRRLVVAVLLLLVAVGVVLWFRSQARPGWWAPPNPRDPHVAEVADRVEYQLVEQAQLVRPVDDTWGVRIYESQINAWLASRLPKWLAHHDLREWSDAVRLVQVNVEDDAVTVGAEISGGLQPRVVSIRLAPVIEDGRLAVVAEAVSVGRISIGTAPIDAAIDELRDVISSELLDDPAVVQIIETLRGERTWPAELELADGRRVEVLELTLEEGAVSARCRTKN